MIKSEQQKNRTLKIIEELKEKKNKSSNIAIGSIDSLIGQLESEIKEYESLKRGEFTLPKNISFVELIKNIAKIRISQGLSQKDLADMLGMTKQQINRYEEHDYQNVSLVKISEIITILGLTVSFEKKENAA